MPAHNIYIIYSAYAIRHTNKKEKHVYEKLYFNHCLAVFREGCHSHKNKKKTIRVNKNYIDLTSLVYNNTSAKEPVEKMCKKTLNSSRFSFVKKKINEIFSIMVTTRC